MVGLAVLGVGRVGVGDAGLARVDPVAFLAAVAEWQDRRDVPATQESDGLAVARPTVGAEALGFGMDAVVGEHVAVGLDEHLAGEDDRGVNIRAPHGFQLGRAEFSFALTARQPDDIRCRRAPPFRSDSLEKADEVNRECRK